ncbi:hypothetical protein QAD02_005792 [Eretmocerus hayati]|uniref:Uncharacterized protein n=1 Tax=Eretmocerus hayati TaxID=131215 RepID=A0ACC2NTD8_9HYME|nr:hypothetical protein QAD02_005792 [Eretmocerus hayati]
MSEDEVKTDVEQGESKSACDDDEETVTNTCDSETTSVNNEGANPNCASDSTKGLAQAPQFVMPKVYVKEKPKVPLKRRDDDVEEFDTDEEGDEDSEQALDSAQQSQHNYTESISYEGDKCIYTEPGTGRKMLWNSEENKWCSYEQAEKEDGQANESAEPPKGVYGFENDTHTYTDPTDGTSYFWDKEKNAWFPKVDDDFMARYQLSYGFNDSNSSSTVKPKSPPQVPENPKPSKEEKKSENKRKMQEPPTWFDVDEAHNTTIYISNLPLDITMEELKELVGKCGLLARDEKGKDKLKLYTDAEGEPKGDARCTYIKIESVNLALTILDGWDIRGKKLSVQRAKFQLKGEYNPALKPKRKKNQKERQKKFEQKLFDWRPDKLRGEPLKCERVVIIKNLFKPEDFDKDVTLILEYQNDIRSECLKCGEVKKVTIHDRHPEGVAQVTFKEPEEAQACVQLLNGRWFSQRQLTAEIWDGKTKYKIKETEEEIEARINKWDKFLEEQEEAEEKSKQADKETKSQPEATRSEETANEVV